MLVHVLNTAVGYFPTDIICCRIISVMSFGLA